MSREFPDFVDAWRAADGRKRISGTIPLARMKRLQPLLASDTGEVRFELRFEHDSQRRATVDVEVWAPLSLMCQRSLAPYIEEIHQRSLLQVIRTPAEQELLSDQEEFLLTEDGRFAVAAVVEDELLLAIPQVPRNPEVERVWRTTARERDTGTGEPGSDAGADTEQKRQRPFGALAEMMKNK
jgi:uncharacterized protein